MKAKALRVAECMTTEVVSVTADTEIMRAVFTLVDNDISGIPVVDAEQRVVGMLTERDFIAIALDAGYFDEPGGQVAKYMSAPVETVGADDQLMDVATRFRDTRFRRFPVVNDGRLIGIISRRDVLRALSKGSWFKH